MALSNLALPINIPWKLISVSPDMMDVTFCDKSFPFDWRSSLAISVFEPKPEDLPDQFCEGKLTYLKITATITGYQPTKDETNQVFISYPDVPIEDLTGIIGQYFACYGALLNVAVFPSTATVSAAHEQYSFDGKPNSLPNPFTDGDLQFSIARAGNLILKPTAPGGPLGLMIESTQLTIDLPTATNVVLEMAIAKTAKGTITAYQSGTQVFSVPLAPTKGVENIAISTSQSVNQIVIQESGDGCLLAGLRYDVQEHAVTLSDYPHILDFEPKTRDLYQAATETGEVLTASQSSVKTGKTLTHTDTSETGLDLSATYKSPPSQYGSVEASGKFSQKWGSTDTDSRMTQGDASRERRETEGTTTNLSQMYNILTGYHPGTNRAVFLMLPRPHILQPTDHRTFVKGLRIIEGVQEFFLVVARPADIEGLCIEASLETGHFPEDVTVTVPPPQYDHNTETFKVSAHGDSGTPYGQKTVAIDTTYSVAAGWVIDRSLGDPAHSGVAETPGGDNSNNQAKSSLRSYNYGAQSDSTAFVTGTIKGADWWGSGAIFDRNYTVFTRSQNAKNGGGGVVASDAIITSRGLCACFKSGDCPEIVDDKKHIGGDWIVDEPKIKIDPAAVTADATQPRLPAMKEMIRGLHYSMATSWRMPTRHAPGEVGFLDSDYFKNQITKVLPPAALNRPVSEVPNLDKGVANPLGGNSKVNDVLKYDLRTFAGKTGLSISAATALRRKLLGLKTP